MRTSTFPYDEGAVNAFLHAPTATLPEALSSPPNTCISITGYVIDVGDIKAAENGTWKRREIRITDNAVILTVKLWNDAVNMPTLIGRKYV